MVVPVRFDMGFPHVLDRQMETSSSMRRGIFPHHPNIEPGAPAKISETDAYLLTTQWFSRIFLSSNVRPMPFEEGAAGGNEFEIEHLWRAFGLSKKSRMIHVYDQMLSSMECGTPLQSSQSKNQNC